MDSDAVDKHADEKALNNFVKYLQFPTVQPEPDYWPAVHWLKEQAKELSLDCKIAEPVKNKPILLFIWRGLDESLPAIFLNSHLDVVPVDEHKWTYPPFGAEIHDGQVFARGSQDMKCVGIQQLESIRRLQMRGMKQPLRTVYVAFVPDEELGGKDGMRQFVFGTKPAVGCYDEVSVHDLNIGVVLDEGLASPNDEYVAFFEERSPWWLEITARGNAGHGSSLMSNTAVVKIHKIMTRLLQFRDQQIDLLAHGKHADGSAFTLGDVTTVNITGLSGGKQTNVIPGEMTIRVDVRLAPSLDFAAFECDLRRWCTDADVELQFTQQDMGTTGVGKINCDPSAVHGNPWWDALFRVCRDHADIKVNTLVFQGSTDARYLRRYHNLDSTPQEKRKRPITAINFSPMRNTKVLLHDHDECLGVDEFLHGCRLYSKLLETYCQMPAF